MRGLIIAKSLSVPFGSLMFSSDRRCGGLQQSARVAALHQEETGSFDMEKWFSCKAQTHPVVLKQSLLEESEVPHALGACRETPDCHLSLKIKVIYL